MAIITLCTDFGLYDSYVGAMKGVILSINPEAIIIDITHGIPKYNVEFARFVLNGYYKYFPKNTIHVVVVDPGVGSKRRSIIIKTKDYIFIGPDNGVFSYILVEHSTVCYEIGIKQGISNTFHGRDVFAPAAGRLSLKWDKSVLGKRINNPVILTTPKAVAVKNGIIGRVIHIDHFGNLITNITTDELPLTGVSKEMCIYVKNIKIKTIQSTYEECKDGAPCAILNSFNLLEIAVKRDSAHEKLGVNIGDKVKVLWE
ncbi:MAG: SAM hydrolase/SAM-dependent halogenase family protein [bacterium]